MDQTPLAGPSEGAIADTNDSPQFQENLIDDMMNTKRQLKDNDPYTLSDARPKTMYTASFAVAEMEIQSKESSPNNRI
jgi:hypothetical protein